MKKTVFILIFALIVSSCASLTTSQIESVNSFATTTTDFSDFPNKILTELSAIRVNRGLMYATTISDAQLKKNELDSIYDQSKFDIQASQKVDITFKVIDKYAQSLNLLSSDKHAIDLGEQAQKFGISIDSLTSLYNLVDKRNNIPSGIGNAVGELISLGGKQYTKRRQAKEIKKFVTQADTLIGVMTNNLLEFLESENIEQLISNEEKMIQRNYLSYLKLNPNASDEYQLRYLELKTSIDAVKKLNEQTIKSTKELSKAHNKLTASITERKKLLTVIKELQSLYEEVDNARTTISEIENIKK